MGDLDVRLVQDDEFPKVRNIVFSDGLYNGHIGWDGCIHIFQECPGEDPDEFHLCNVADIDKLIEHLQLLKDALRSEVEG